MKRKFKAPRRKSETKLSKVSESKPLKRRKGSKSSTKTMEIKDISTDPEKSEEEQIEIENDYDNTNGTESKLKLTQDAEDSSDSEVDYEMTGLNGIPKTRITIIRNDKDHSPESQSEDIEVDDDESNTNGNPSESDPEQGIEDEMDGDKVVENETESVADSPEAANSQNEDSIENEEDLKEIKESESVSIDIDDEADDSKGTESEGKELDHEEGQKQERNDNEEDIVQHTESPKIKAITDRVNETGNKSENNENPKNQKIAPFESVEEYLLKDGDGEKRRASLRSAKQQKIRIAPMSDQQWNIVFAESHISTSDKVQIRKLIEMNFDRSYVRDAMSGMDQNPLKYILFKNEKDQIVSFLSYIERNGLWFLVRDIVTMKGYDHRLGSMLLLALQWQFERKGLDFIHRLHAEVEVDDTKFWDQEDLRMVNVEKYNKRLSVIGNQVKRNQDLCEYIWIGTVEEAEKKLLEYLNMFHFKVPCSK